jgi:hypothetical protein
VFFWLLCYIGAVLPQIGSGGGSCCSLFITMHVVVFWVEHVVCLQLTGYSCRLTPARAV